MRILAATRLRPAAALAARRRVAPAAARAESSSSETSGRRHRVLFLGTPAPAAGVLTTLLAAASSSAFDVVGVVTQPGKPQGRRRTVVPSPVAAVAAAAGFEGVACGDPLPPRPLLTPPTPKDAAFLDAVKGLAPDLAVTVAYGGLLPQSFLDIPPRGTLNIHPSLLPCWRGAAPVQRALEAGDAVVGVSVAYTVLALDSGPVLAREEVPTPPDVDAPDLLVDLMNRGAQLLLDALPAVWDGTAPSRATPQDDAGATHAPRLGRGDGILNLTAPAATVHNRARATAGWPGASVRLAVGDGDAADVKVSGVRRVDPDAAPSAATSAPPASIVADKDGIYLICGDGGVLSVETVTPPGRKPVGARAFFNGLAGREVRWVA